MLSFAQGVRKLPRSFKLIVAGQSISALGTLMVGIALDLYVLHKTGSALRFSFMLALQVTAQIFFGPAIGEFVDSIRKKPVLVFFDGLRAVISMSLFVLVMAGGILGIYAIYALVVFYSGCEIFFDPALTSLVPKMVDESELARANMVYGALSDVSYALGPLIGAVAYGSVGLGGVFLVDGLTYVVATILEIPIRIGDDERLAVKFEFWGSYRRGLRLIFSERRIKYLVINEILNHVFLFPFLSVFLPFLIIRVLHGPNYAYGLVGFIATLGSISSVLISARWERRFSMERNVSMAFFSLVGFAFFLIPFLFKGIYAIFSHAGGIWLSVYWGGANFELYLFFAVYLAFYTTLFQSSLPEGVIARFYASQATIQALSRVMGIILYGILLQVFPPEVCVGVLILALFINGAVHILYVREFSSQTMVLKIRE